MVLRSLACAAILTGWAVASHSSPAQTAAPLDVMKRAADWQLANPSRHPPYDWTQAAFFTGVMALADASGDPKYHAAMRAVGEANRWRPGLRPGHADDYAVISTYAKLAKLDSNPGILAPSLALFDFLAGQRYDESLEWGNRIEYRELAWCDALFMAPPAMAAVSVATGDPKYLALGNRLWWKTTEYLYDTTEHLYYRDSRYFARREPNGRKVFWSRGNGWVIAGIARMLDDMPVAFPDRPRYVTLFKEMATTIAALQGEDGFWRASLLDPASLPNPESSGTGFFTYALAWGINRGVLDRAVYEPHVRRGWAAMQQALQPDGMLGWVQPIGAEPGSSRQDTTEVYGVGALLLAGAEVHRLDRAR